MFRQIPAALASAFLLSGCGVMQTSEELVQSTTLQPSSQILLNNTAVEVEVSPPNYTLDGRRHTDDYFDLLAEAAASKTMNKAISKHASGEPANRAISKRASGEPANRAISKRASGEPANRAISKRASGEPANRAIIKRNGDYYADLATFDTVYSATDSVPPDKTSVDAEPLAGSTDHPAENAIFFAFGSNELNMNGRVLLDNFVEQLNSSDLIELTGYTCNIGPDHVNQNLSRNRAQMVKAYLMFRGVDASRIVTEGKGKENPAASNNDKTTRMINRRVEMKVSR